MHHSLPLLHLQPDELVTGYLGRLGLRLDLEWQPTDLRHRLYQRIRELGYKVRGDIFSIIEFFSGTSRKTLIEFNSVAPFSYAFDGNDRYNQRGLDVDSWGPYRPFSVILLSQKYFARETLGLSDIPKVCPHCMQEDLQEHGFSYWHQIHQSPGALSCPRHAKRLVAIANSFSFYRQPHHVLVGRKSEDEPNEIARIFHDRMTQIWMGILSSRRMINYRRAKDLLAQLYPNESIYDSKFALMRIKAASESYSVVLSEFASDPGYRFFTLYKSRFLVAALAASTAEIQSLINALTDISHTEPEY